MSSRNNRGAAFPGAGAMGKQLKPETRLGDTHWKQPEPKWLSATKRSKANGDFTMKRASQTFGAIFIASALLIAAQPATAQQVCVPHEKAALKLQEQYDEQVIGRGLTPNGTAMFELFVSESGSWTVLVSQPSGQSCVVATGDSWQQVPLLVGDPA